MADTTAISANPPMSRSRLASLLVGVAILVTALQYLGFLPAALHRLPEALVPDFARYLDAFFNFVKDDLGLFALTRWLTGLLQAVLDTTANLLFGKRRWPNLGPIPWTAIAASMAVLGYYLGGWSMAALVAVTFCWTALDRSVEDCNADHVGTRSCRANWLSSSASRLALPLGNHQRLIALKPILSVCKRCRSSPTCCPP